MTRPLRRFAPAIAVVALSFATVGCSHHQGSQAKFCAQVKEVPALQTVLQGYQTADATELQARLSSARSHYDALVSAAPSSIHDDVATLVGLVDAVIDSTKAHPHDAKAIAADLRTYVKAHPGANAATSKVDTYASDTCGVDLGPGTNPPG